MWFRVHPKTLQGFPAGCGFKPVVTERSPSVIAAFGREALERGDVEQADRVSALLLGSFVRYPRALVLRALLSEQKGDVESALDDLQVVASAEPSNPEARAFQARLFLAGNDVDRARTTARQALELVPNDDKVLSVAFGVLNVGADALEVNAAVLARVYMRLGWPELAERQARIAISEMPERVDVRLTYAEALWRLGRLSTCEAQCRVVTDQAEDCVRAAVMRAHILSERGRTAEGQDLLERVGQIDPEFEEARQLLASLEVHRLVLPEIPVVKLPEGLLAAFSDSAPEGALEDSGDALARVEGSEHSVTREVDDTSEEGSEVDSGSSSKTESMDEARGRVSGEVTPITDVVESAIIQESSTEHLSEDTTSSVFSTVAWAHDLIRRQQWREACNVLSDVVKDSALDIDEVDGLLLEASACPELSPDVWQLLGDHYMRTSRPQAAADAYFRATEVSDEDRE